MRFKEGFDHGMANAKEFQSDQPVMEARTFLCAPQPPRPQPPVPCSPPMPCKPTPPCYPGLRK